ncbi:50S ribosomal protein L23 [Candidatus Peregrinibacteria bacterium]|nr:50S ribosomal protein L23 [Candidatus Peregrinibacteria bacterium]
MDLTTYTTLLAPVVSEKSSKMAEEGKYSFYISPRATKINVKNAVKRIYGAEVEKVNIVKSPSKSRWGKGRKLVTKRDARVKAIVTIKDKKTIDINNIK